jgi:hypothetical protein
MDKSESNLANAQSTSGSLASIQFSREASEKLRRFIELTSKSILASGSTNSEASESSEASEDSENSEGSEDSESSEESEGSEDMLFQNLLAVNPGPDEWGPLLSAAEQVAKIAELGR